MYGNHLRYAEIIIKGYDGKLSLSAYLKDFFRSHKQMGSKDRKTVSNLVYGYFRLGHLEYETIGDRLMAVVNKSPKAGRIFPWLDELSAGIDPTLFTDSFMIQPDLFIRIRKPSAIAKLDAAGIGYYFCGENCIGLPNATRIDDLLDIDSEAVIQDRSSQRTGAFLDGFINLHVWDCCAASGGKSIMAYDRIPGIELTVSDLRPSILSNLKKRFTAAGIIKYSSFVADLAKDAVARKFDLIIADVPCSGSGTWQRTPEQLYYFKKEKIEHYQQLQRQILTNTVKSLKPGAYLLYITCSVFRKENEDQLDFLNELGLRTLSSELLSGYAQKADTLFAALLQFDKLD